MSESERIAFGGHASPWGTTHSAKFAMPSWAWEHKPRWLAQGAVKVEAEALASKESMMEPMEICFVRSERGWLCHADKGRVWMPEFHMAKAFFSKEQAALAGEASFGGDCSIVSASMTVGAVAPSKAGGLMDAESREIAAMCEAAREARELASQVAVRPGAKNGALGESAKKAKRMSL